MNRERIVILVIVIAVATVGISYGVQMLNSQTPQPSTPSANCASEEVAGNFTSSPQMNETSTGPYNVTFYIRNLAPQPATIIEYTDANGLTQSVNWVVPASMTENFYTTIYKTENSLALETSCDTFFTAYVYYLSTSNSVHTNHYAVTLSVSLGNVAS